MDGAERAALGGLPTIHSKNLDHAAVPSLALHKISDRSLPSRGGIASRGQMGSRSPLHSSLEPTLEVDGPALRRSHTELLGSHCRPFTTSSNWPGNQQIPKSLTARYPYMESEHRMSPEASYRGLQHKDQSSASIIPDITNMSFSRVSTPEALYSGQFFAAAPAMSFAASGANLFGSPRSEKRPGFATSRDWQKLVMRVTGSTADTADLAIMADSIRAILGKDASLHVFMSDGSPVSHVAMQMTEKPSSRRQAQLLGMWFQTQLATLASSPIPPSQDHRSSQDGRWSGSPPRTQESSFLPSSNLGRSGLDSRETEMAKRLLSRWGRDQVPGLIFLHSCGHTISVEGLSVPNDHRYIRGVLQVANVAAAAAIHQISMHCHERGLLLSQVWNMCTGLMDMEINQLRFQVQVLAGEKQKLLLQLQTAGYHASTAQGKAQEILNLKNALQSLKGELAIKETELDSSQLEVQRLQEVLLSWGESGLSRDEIGQLQEELYEAQAEREEAERTRDIALTALFAGVERSLEVGKSITEIKTTALGSAYGNDAQVLEKLFNKITQDVEKITAMEQMVESKMDVGRGKAMLGPGFITLAKAKTAAKKLMGLKNKLIKNAAAAAEVGGAGTDQSQTLKSDPTMSKVATDMEMEAILESTGVNVIPEIMLEADMQDVESMEEPEMWEEIQRLRERENTLLYAIKQLIDDKEQQIPTIPEEEEDVPGESLPPGQQGKQGRKGGKRKGNKGNNKGNKGGVKGGTQAGAPGPGGDEENAEIGSQASQQGVGGTGPEGASDVSTPLLDMVGASMGPGGVQMGSATAETRGLAGPTSGGAGIGSTGVVSNGGSSRRISISINGGGVGGRPGAGNTGADKKDTIIMMMRALVSSREKEVDMKKARYQKMNKSNKVLAVMQAKTDKSELEMLLRQANEATAAVLGNAKYLHAEYLKLWNLLQSSGTETRGLCSPDAMVSPDQALRDAQPKTEEEEKFAKTAMASPSRRKLGAAQRAKKAVFAEKVAGSLSSGQSKGAAKKEGSSAKNMGVEQPGSSSTGGTKRMASRRLSSTGKDSPDGEAAAAAAAAEAGGGGGGGAKMAKQKMKMAGITKKGSGGSGMLANLGSEMVTQAKQSAFACKDAALKEAIFKYKNVKPRAKEWVLKLIDKVYEAKAAQDEKLSQNEEELVSMPSYLFSHLQAQYGAKSLVQEYASSVVCTIRHFINEDIRLQTFSKFLSQEWDTPVLRIFLDAQARISAQGALATACCEFPDSYVPGRGYPPWLCTWKAMVLSDMLLGRRSDKCTEGFYSILDNHSCAIDDSEKAKFFWSPKLAASASDSEREAAARQEEEARNQNMSKLSTAQFLSCLCVEYFRCEDVLDEAVPSLFKEHDADFSGYLDKNEVYIMLRALHGNRFDEAEAQKVWEIAEDLERMQAQEEGVEPPEGEVGVTAFSGAVKRTDAVRRYIRLEKTPPPPPEVDAEHKASQSKMLYLVIERHWKSFEDAVDRIMDGGHLEAAESNIRGQVTKMMSEKDGAKRAQMFVSILKTLCDFMLVKIQRQCNSSVLSSVFDPTMEPNMERVEKAVKVLFGWKTMLEDDSKAMQALGNPNSGLAARKIAVKNWVDQSRAFLEYKEQLQAQATAILQRKFAGRWRRKQGNGGIEAEGVADVVPVSHVLRFLKAQN